MKHCVKKEIAEAVSFFAIEDDRFKNAAISVAFTLPLSERTVSSYAMLTRAMVRTCRAYPDYTLLSKKLSSLYGASLSASAMKYGDRLTLLFSIIGLDDRYALEGDKISEELSTLLCEIIFSPNTKDGAFTDEDTQFARRELFDMIDAELNEKRIYATNRAISVMCQGEAYAISPNGTREGAARVTKEELFAAWQTMLKTARVDLFFVGESSPEKVESILAEKFFDIEREPATLTNVVIESATDVKRETEEMELSQSKMILGLRTGATSCGEGMFTERLLNAVLGGTAHSKLFNNVREKMSLCYYCSSSFDRKKGIMLISSGVERENIEKAETAILAEIEAMKNGEITDFEIESAKLSLINAFRESESSVMGITSWYFSQIFDSEMRSVQSACEMIEAVTKDELIAAAKNLSLDTVYTLKGVSKGEKA